MSEVVWKGFKLGDLFERSTKLACGLNQKDLDLSDVKDELHTIALISASRNGSGRVGYINKDLVNKNTISKNKITFDDQWGYTFFQQEDFIITGGHNAILEVIESKLKKTLDENLCCYSFLSLIINQITIKSDIFGYGYKINNKFDREIILLPCIETTGDDYIWDMDGKKWTLAVEYIKHLMDEAKELREQKTIRLYEAERKKYEAERKKYEAEYNVQKSKVVWKGFKLGELFETSTEHYLEKSKKNYDISEMKDEDHTVAVCAASKYNNGIVGYISEIDDVSVKKRKGFLTKGGFGHFFYQDDWFIKPGGSWGMLDIIKIKNECFKSLCNDNKNIYYFLAKLLTHMFEKITKRDYQMPFDREIILLPCIETTGDDYIWDMDGKKWTLAVEYILYIYLTGRINHSQKLINNYTYQY